MLSFSDIAGKEISLLCEEKKKKIGAKKVSKNGLETNKDREGCCIPT